MGKDKTIERLLEMCKYIKWKNIDEKEYQKMLNKKENKNYGK